VYNTLLTIYFTAAKEFAKVLALAQNFSKGATIRGFAADISNCNPYIANPRANYAERSNSYDESHYAQSLIPHLVNASLPYTSLSIREKVVLRTREMLRVIGAMLGLVMVSDQLHRRIVLWLVVLCGLSRPVRAVLSIVIFFNDYPNNHYTLQFKYILLSTTV
jgi:hypothetical protein